MEIEKAEGKLGVLVVGLGGAVSSTFVVGTLSVRKGLAEPIGSLTQLAHLPLGKGEEKREPKIKDVIPLADLNDVVIGGWDIFEENVYDRDDLYFYEQALSDAGVEPDDNTGDDSSSSSDEESEDADLLKMLENM